jgi:hypothetical protein
VSKHFQTIRDINDALKTAGRNDGELVLEAIEALKRWIYSQAYQGTEKEPVPKTEDEFSILMDGLRRWATLHAPHIDTGRLQDYRRAELRRRAEGGFTDRAAEKEWKQAYQKADDALNELKILLTEAEEKKSKKRMTRQEANERAMELVKRYRKQFVMLSESEQARQIGCSWQTWKRTELFKKIHKQKNKLLPRKRAGSRRPVSLTHDLESVTGEGKPDEVLNQLLHEHESDFEPSPLDDSRPRKFHSRKRL